MRRDSGINNLNVIVRLVKEDIMDADGPVRFAWESYRRVNPKLQADNDKGSALIAEAFKDSDTLLLTKVNGVVDDDRHVFLVEVEGTGDYSRQDLMKLQDRLRSQIGDATLYVWFNHGVVLTDKGLVPYNELLKERIASFSEEVRQSLRNLLKNVR